MRHIVAREVDLFGVDVQDQLTGWWVNGGAVEVLGSIECGDGKTGLDYPLGFVTVDTTRLVDPSNPLANPQYVLTYDPPGAETPADFYGPCGLFANVAGKGRAGEREGEDSLTLESQPWRFRPGDFRYGGWVRLDGRKGGASGLPGGGLDDAAVRAIFAKLNELEEAAARPYLDAVEGRVKGGPNEQRVKYMLLSGYVITERGALVRDGRGGGW